jgi:hypothetical protein
LRSCDVLWIARNCQIVIGFGEILRSENKREVVQALANLYHLAPNLPRLLVCDAGCLLVKFLRGNFINPNKLDSILLPRETAILHDEVCWIIDRFYLQHHTDVNWSSVFPTPFDDTHLIFFRNSVTPSSVLVVIQQWPTSILEPLSSSTHGWKGSPIYFQVWGNLTLVSDLCSLDTCEIVSRST